jgi:hypothetical protein
MMNGCWWVGGTPSTVHILLGQSDLGFSAWGSVVVSQPPAVYIASIGVERYFFPVITNTLRNVKIT